MPGRTWAGLANITVTAACIIVFAGHTHIRSGRSTRAKAAGACKVTCTTVTTGATVTTHAAIDTCLYGWWWTIAVHTLGTGRAVLTELARRAADVVTWVEDTLAVVAVLPGLAADAHTGVHFADATNATVAIGAENATAGIAYTLTVHTALFTRASHPRTARDTGAFTAESVIGAIKALAAVVFNTLFAIANHIAGAADTCTAVTATLAPETDFTAGAINTVTGIFTIVIDGVAHLAPRTVHAIARTQAKVHVGLTQFAAGDTLIAVTRKVALTCEADLTIITDACRLFVDQAITVVIDAITGLCWGHRITATTRIGHTFINEAVAVVVKTITVLVLGCKGWQTRDFTVQA